jgi:hypothetical protein
VICVNLMTRTMRETLYARRYREKHPEKSVLTPEKRKKASERSLEWCRRNPDKVKKSNRKWGRNNPDKLKRLQAQSRLKRHGWSLESKSSALIKQNNLCAICNQPFTENNPAFGDHEHTSPPMPRGLLHNQCNAAIGMLLDSPEICEAAAAYLRSWQKEPNEQAAHTSL